MSEILLALSMPMKWGESTRDETFEQHTGFLVAQVSGWQAVCACLKRSFRVGRWIAKGFGSYGRPKRAWCVVFEEMGDIDQHDVHAGIFEGNGLWHTEHDRFEKSLVVSSRRLRTNIFVSWRKVVTHGLHPSSSSSSCTKQWSFSSWLCSQTTGSKVFFYSFSFSELELESPLALFLFSEAAR